MKPFRYRIIVEWSDEDEAFIGRVPAFPGCASHGETPQEATKEAMTAAMGMLESMRERGEELPPEDVTVDFSGQLRLRLPTFLHERLARLAAAEGVSLNQELVALLSHGAGTKVDAGGRTPGGKARTRKAKKEVA